MACTHNTEYIIVWTLYKSRVYSEVCCTVQYIQDTSKYTLGTMDVTMTVLQCWAGKHTATLVLSPI